MLAVTGDVRRSRLRLMRVAGTQGAAFDPPLLSLSPRHLRRVDSMDEPSVLALDGAREELWASGKGARMRCTIDEQGKLGVRFTADDQEPTVRRLARIPLGTPGTSGASRYYGRWEYAKDAAVLSPRGAGVIVHPDSTTFSNPPELVDVYEGEGVLLALRNVPNGARVVCADGVEGLEVGALISDVRVPDIARGPDVEIHPRESFLRGFPPIGLRASFAGIDFAGFAPTQGDGSRHLARFTKKQRGIAYGAVRPVETPEDEDALITAALSAELKPSSQTGRIKRGSPGTIKLTDDRRYRVRACVRERIPSGAFELVVCALLDGALLLTVCVPFRELLTPDASVVLSELGAFLIGLHVVRAE